MTPIQRAVVNRISLKHSVAHITNDTPGYILIISNGYYYFLYDDQLVISALSYPDPQPDLVIPYSNPNLFDELDNAIK